MSGYKFTFVIGFRYKSDRISLLRRTLDWVNTFKDVEVILVEQDNHSKIGHLDLKCKHIFVKSDKPYNRSWAFNVALRRSNSDVIIFGDSDLMSKINIKIIDKSYLFELEIVKKERINLIEKASVCVNGISLTISKLTKKGFQIWVIPHTFKLTNLSSLKKNSLVNIEIDILSKYVRNYFNEKK